MSILRKGGYVNAVPEDQVPLGVDHNGITLRDYFAAKALQGVLANPDMSGPANIYAEDAYALADAMLKAREQQS